jgi:hypothetical protein
VRQPLLATDMFPLTWNQPHPRCFRCRPGCCPSGIWCSRGDAVLPGFRPCRGWHLEPDLRRCFQWCRCNALVVGGDSARSLRSLAEWCAPPNKTRGKDGRRGRLCRCQSPSLRRPHHSATRDSSERNLLFNPACGAPFHETRERRAEPPPRRRGLPRFLHKSSDFLRKFHPFLDRKFSVCL